MKRTIASISILLVAIIVGLAALIPQFQMIAAMRNSDAANTENYDVQIASLKSENQALTLALEDADTKAASEAQKAAIAERVRRQTRMEALNQLLAILNAPSINRQSSLIAGQGWEAELMKNHFDGLGTLLTPEMKAALESIGDPLGYAFTYPGYFDWPGKLSPNFGKLFALDDAVVRHLNDVVVDTTRDVEDSILAATSVQRESPTRITLVSMPVPQKVMIRNRDRFISEFSTALGDEGYAALTTLTSQAGPEEGFRYLFGGPEELFDAFGAYGHSISIDKLENGRYNAHLQWNLAPGQRMKGTTPGGLGNAPGEVFRAHLGFLAKLLPPDF